MYECVSWGKKCKFFGKFCVRTKWMNLKVKNLKEGIFSFAKMSKD